MLFKVLVGGENEAVRFLKDSEVRRTLDKGISIGVNNQTTLDAIEESIGKHPNLQLKEF